MRRSAALCLSITAACSGPVTWIDDPSADMPAELADLGVYPDPADRGTLHPRAIAYEPEHPLWTNGSDKQRFLILPASERVDNAAGAAWSFPEGTVLVKTFSYEGRPVETRILLRAEEDWSYAVYRWDEDGTDAELLDITRPTPIEVEAFGERFEHDIPSERQCRTCHASTEVNVLGFSEVQLAESLPDLAARGVFIDPPPAAPERVEHEDPPTQEVLEYFAGNCVHCHNGVAGPSTAFDLRHDAALENLIGVEATSGAVAGGLRVAPGEPEESVLFQSFSGMNDLPMPLLGVQRRDAAAVAMFDAWIESLEP